MYRKLLAIVLFTFACSLTLYAAQAADEAPPPRPVGGDGDKKPDGKGKFGNKFGKGGKFSGKFGKGGFGGEGFKGKFDPEKFKDFKGKFGDKFGKGKFKKGDGESDE